MSGVGVNKHGRSPTGGERQVGPDGMPGAKKNFKLVRDSLAQLKERKKKEEDKQANKAELTLACPAAVTPAAGPFLYQFAAYR